MTSKDKNEEGRSDETFGALFWADDWVKDEKGVVGFWI